MNVLWQMVIAVKEKSISVLIEYARHTSKFNQKPI
jgi:hypothetical protein